MSELQATATAEYAPPDCAVCERSLLVGEGLRLFRDDRTERLVKVCELCRERATLKGFELVGAYGTPRLRVQPSGSVSDVADREALIEGMGQELAYLKQQLGEAHSALSEHSLQADTVRAITAKLRMQERELQALRRQADPNARALAQRTISEQTEELRRLREALHAREQQVARLQAARQAETRPVVMCGHALHAFNSSEQADRMMRIARTLGDPVATVRDLGPALPRRIHITLAWDIAWYEFCVKVDVAAGRASVHEVASGGDSSTLPADQLAGNAVWRTSGLVLASAASL